MNKYVQVLKTYAWRPRFWLLVPVFLITPPYFSACIAMVLVCFVALHVRRQFGTAAAQLVPGFTAPHLVVGGLISLVIWAGIPALQAWRFDMPIESVVAIHALTGLLLALVIIWPRAIMIVAAVPVAISWGVTNTGRNEIKWLEEYAATGDLRVSIPLIAITLVAHGLAVLRLLRLNDQIAVSDDLSSDLPKFDGAAGRVEEWLLGQRDAVVARHLANAGRGLWGIQRWRVPVAVAWPQLAMFPITVAVAILAVRSASTDPLLIIFMLTAATAVFVFAPLAPWRGRQNWIATEVTRPVSRDQYFCETAAALACDIFIWFIMLAAVGGLVIALFADGKTLKITAGIATHVATLAGLGVFLFGLSLFTIRWRYWFPVLIISTIVWSFISVWGLALAMAVGGALRQVPLLLPVLWAVVSAGVGIILAQRARIRWAQADLG